MEDQAKFLEKEAYLSLSQEKFEEAYRLFRIAAQIYKRKKNHKQAALCFASAASCWSKRAGERAFYKSALSYEDAAKQAKDSKDFAYASLLYKHAARSHEKDGEFADYSDCFYSSKECYRKFLTYRIFKPKKIKSISGTGMDRGTKGFFRAFFSWLMFTFSYAVWGHGERPARTLFAGILLIILSAFLHTFGILTKGDVLFTPNFFQAFYFSVVTFTTLGYGDIVPIGFSKLVAIIEAFCGLFIIPLFIIGLSRKYLRI
jgi:hypothetical protein